MTPPAEDVLDGLAALFLALDAQGRIAFWNRRLEEVTGYSRAEMLGQPGEVLVTGDDPRPLLVKNGGQRLIRWQLSPSLAGQGGRRHAVGVDVTDDHEKQARAIRAERLAAVETLAAGLAHEVRNPLNAALLQLTVLRRRLERPDCPPASLQPVAALVEQELQRLDRLVDDFIAFAQPRPLDLRRTDVASLCRSIAANLAQEAAAARVQVDLDLPESVPALQADPERLQHVLLNLARNGLEAMSGDGTLTLRVRHRPEAVEVDVCDTGPGFPEGAPIFDAFFTTKPTGTGLGLSIVHRIVSDHGGSVRVRSRPGDTCFTVVLPLKS